MGADFIASGGGGAPLTMAGLAIAGSAGLDVVEEMKAALAGRKAWSAVIGLAVVRCCQCLSNACSIVADVPRSASAPVCRAVANMVASPVEM